jgi:hypothetical protein
VCNTFLINASWDFYLPVKVCDLCLITPNSHDPALHRLQCNQSLFLPFIIQQRLPRGFLHDLIIFAIADDSFEPIFRPLLYNLSAMMSTVSLDTDEFKYPLMLLAELCEMKVDNTRPIASLVRLETLLFVILSYIFHCIF